MSSSLKSGKERSLSEFFFEGNGSFEWSDNNESVVLMVNEIEVSRVIFDNLRNRVGFAEIIYETK